MRDCTFPKLDPPRFVGGQSVMLCDDAPFDLQLLLGSESVMTLVFHSRDVSSPHDWPVTWTVVHEHRGRIFFDVPESALRSIDKEAAQAQRMIHNEMTKAIALELFPEGLPTTTSNEGEGRG